MAWFSKKAVEDDPNKVYKVARRHRLDTDHSPDSNALVGGDDTEDFPRFRPGGDLYDDRVVSPEELA